MYLAGLRQALGLGSLCLYWMRQELQPKFGGRAEMLCASGIRFPRDSGRNALFVEKGGHVDVLPMGGGCLLPIRASIHTGVDAMQGGSLWVQQQPPLGSSSASDRHVIRNYYGPCIGQAGALQHTARRTD
ncbi:hypothetical protein NDU88_005466 [Pleurodeles waltl]|uniref:Uncharacterized protein n=1 Tax=Pleurodeles waltl TaxID=8319 RepID=A0AAV7WC12_PLEWA|nr:hypothetical protein NDU88_005466 [Pleurodeles waltl]